MRKNGYINAYIYVCAKIDILMHTYCIRIDLRDTMYQIIYQKYIKEPTGNIYDRFPIYTHTNYIF